MGIHIGIKQGINIIRFTLIPLKSPFVIFIGI